MFNVGETSLLWVVPVLGIQSCIRKQTKQDLKHKPVCTTPPWLLLQSPPPGFCLEFLVLASFNALWPGYVSQIALYIHSLLFVLVLITTLKTILRHQGFSSHEDVYFRVWRWVLLMERSLDYCFCCRVHCDMDAVTWTVALNRPLTLLLSFIPLSRHEHSIKWLDTAAHREVTACQYLLLLYIYLPNRRIIYYSFWRYIGQWTFKEVIIIVYLGFYEK